MPTGISAQAGLGVPSPWLQQSQQQEGWQGPVGITAAGTAWGPQGRAGRAPG